MWMVDKYGIMIFAKFIKHKNINEELLNQISLIKDSCWNYGRREQRDWINRNIKPNDIHVLLFSEKKHVAYLNLVELRIEYSIKSLPAFGIGNVCALKKGSGFGKNILEILTKFSRENNIPLILYCKESLVDFYKKFDFKLHQDSIKDRNLMYFNVFDGGFKYLGKDF